MGGGKEGIRDLADLVPNRGDRKRVVPGLRNYLSNPSGLQTDETFGNESDQLLHKPLEVEPDKSEPESERGRVIVVRDGSTMSIPQLLAEVSPR